MRKYTPKPSGPFTVGCTDMISKYGPDRSFFRIYYPMAKEAEVTETNASLWLDETEYATGYANFIKLKFASGLFRWLFSDTCTYAVKNGKFALPDGISKLPVIVFSHGLGANKSTYSAICSDLASRGTFVVALEHADQSASATYSLEINGSHSSGSKNQEVLKKWVPFLRVPTSPDELKIRNDQVHFRGDDCSKVLDQLNDMNEGRANFVQCSVDLSQFKNAFDLGKCAVIGHSFGGASAIAALYKDKRFKLGIGMDTWMFPLDENIYKKIHPVPFFFINSEAFHWPSNIAQMRKLDADTFKINAERLMVTLNGTVHQSQTDFPLLVANNMLCSFFRIRGIADPLSVHEVNVKLVYSFLAKHLQLDFDQSVQDVMEIYKDSVYHGTNVAVDEEKIKRSKEALRASM